MKNKNSSAKYRRHYLEGKKMKGTHVVNIEITIITRSEICHRYGMWSRVEISSTEDHLLIKFISTPIVSCCCPIKGGLVCRVIGAFRAINPNCSPVKVYCCRSRCSVCESKCSSLRISVRFKTKKKTKHIFKFISL